MVSTTLKFTLRARAKTGSIPMSVFYEIESGPDQWIRGGWLGVRAWSEEQERGSSSLNAGSKMDILKSEILRKRQLVEDRNLLVHGPLFRVCALQTCGSQVYSPDAQFVGEFCVASGSFCLSSSDSCALGITPFRNQIQPKEEDQKPLTSSNPVLELELAEEKLPMTLSRQEVIRRLRERGEPIRLFGETDYDAFQRLRKIEILTPEVNKGLRNDLKAALDKIDQQYLNELVGGQEPGEEDTQNDLKVHEENTTIEELEALGESLGKGDDHKDMDIITKFLKFLLGVWAKELNAREDYVKRSVQGKLNSATQKQTESYLRPLFRKLRKRNLPADIKESITDIIKFMLQREYVKANDAYLQMAIGNAPWPIGVTMVGIHARTGREKIFSKHVAHVLNDETQRKYIQGLKRLMTICQKHFPTDPSKCVEYNAL
ncbi:Pre-mRNA splicing factor 18 isoform 3-like protein [Camelus ferus]|nr:Pre-mRNA splicing factor 18 isoform 3-like protein [Camelus ferus]